MKKIIFLFILINFLSYSEKQEKEIITEAACGQCKFGMKSQKGCDLAVKIDDKTYFIDGAHIDGFGDAHDIDKGFCNTIRKVKITGKIEHDRYKVSQFKIIE
ncbi:hypothetical protein C7447_101284 [Tenacibaculum adriaticum]|uniref:Uncharacterized protein n=1 Tax=Tenacibaculum adriaticum TaxID=413713 RepID=A0A5S5DUM7_9FLAO|nr:DUF6370 family protein [Tenacibaculum adriaticum]TYP99680.1 hypothetical protein C7447_101284 [Tenacibaculum adriaticum]